MRSRLVHRTVFALLAAGGSHRATPALGAEETIAVFAVDLRRAILATPEGRKIKVELERLRRSEEQRVREAEAALRKDKKTLTAAEYRQRFEAIQAQIKGATEKLDEAQAARLEPLLAQLRRLVATAEKDGVQVLDASREAALGLPDACDKTARLVTAYNGKASVLALGDPPKPCRFRGLLYVDFDTVVKGLPESRTVTARLDALQKKRQTQIEQQKRRLVEIQNKARESKAGRWREEAKQRAHQLEQTYRAFQKEIRDAEGAAQQRLYGKVEKAAQAFSGRHAGLLFVEYFTERPRRDRSCEVSDWMIREVRGGGGMAGLQKRCRWLR